MREDSSSRAILLSLLVIGLLGFLAFQAGVFSIDPYVDPRPYPDKPADLTRQSVGEYAKACERAIVWNRRLSQHDGKLTRISVSTNDVAVTNQSGAWKIHVEYAFSTRAGSSAGDGRGVVEYFVDESVTLRDGGGPSAGKEELDPARNGTVVTNC